MTDETRAALQCAGPDSWHHLIAPTRTFPLTDDAIEVAALSMDSTLNCPYSIDAIPKEAADATNDPLAPKIEIGERGDDNRVTVTIDMVPLSSTYDVP